MKTIQVRNVPEELHRELEARAATAELSLSELILQELRELASRPASEELLERLRRRSPVTPSVPVA